MGKDRDAMKVCFFSGDITRAGGTERVCVSIAASLASLGHEVSILSVTQAAERPFYPIPDEVSRHALCGSFPTPGLAWIPVYYKLCLFMKRMKLDVLVDVDGVLDILSLSAAHRVGTALISWEHFDFDHQFGSGYRKLAGSFARKADAIVTLTDGGRIAIEQRLRPKGQTVCIPNPYIGSDRERHLDFEKENLILSVGRLCPQKGFDMLVDCAAIVLDKQKNWKWVVVGNGAERGSLEDKARAQGLDNRLLFLRETEAIEEWYKIASLFVMTSRYEGLPMVLLEALAFGLPVVAFDVPTGPRELLEGRKHAVLIPPFNIDDMAEAICKVIESEEHKSEDYEGLPPEYSINSITAKWEALLRNVSDTGR